MDYCKSFTHGGVPDKIAGVVFGHALGDAVGFTCEYKPQGTVPQYPYNESIRGIVPNDWTDDTDLMLISMGAMIESNMHWSAVECAFKFRYWLEKGLVQCDYTAPKTPSNLFREIVTSPDYIKDPLKTAADIDRKARGVLNTNLPLSYIAFAGVMPNPRETAINFCSLTNPDKRCIAACVFYSISIHKLVYSKYAKQSVQEIIDDALKEAGDYYDLSSIVDEVTSNMQISKYGLAVEPINEVFKCLKCVVWALRVCETALSQNKVPKFMETIKAVALQGGDADANCGVVGSILGACFGQCFDATSLPYYTRLSGFTAYFINRLFMPNVSKDNEEAANK